MDTLKKFLCDWGTPDSNMLLFFLLTSFLLGLLAGWLIWGRKIQAMLNQVAERDSTITDLNGKLIIKEDELGKANKSNDELQLKNRNLSEEKGQLHAEAITLRAENEQLKAAAIAIPVVPIAAAAAVAMPEIAIEPVLPTITPELEITNDESESLIDILANEPETAIENAVIDEPVEDVIEKSVQEDEKAEEKQEESAAAISPDDLKIVEGIGPKIEGLLNDAGILTFKQLSEASIERLNEILAAAGRRYQIHDPATWPRQAAMAFNNQWDELKIWQDNLKGGKE